MSRTWDTIIVGAGMGGMSAAALLVRAGLRVLVLERSTHPGGTAYVYKRGGFTFPTGPLGFSTPGLVREVLSAVNQDAGLNLRRVHYKVSFGGAEVPLSLAPESLVREMSRRFPDESEGIGRFFRDVEEIQDAMRFPDHAGSRRLLDRAKKTSARDHIEERIDDWRLRRILGSLGTEDAYTGLPLLAAMWGLMTNEGIWYPQGGMASFAHRLARAVTGDDRGNGGRGEIRLGAPVAGIRVSAGKVSGVTLDDGTGIDAANIISNADYKTTFLTLMPPGSMPEEWSRAVGKAKQTDSIFQVCLGVDASRIDLYAFSDASRILFRGEGQTPSKSIGPVDWRRETVAGESLAGQELEVSLWSKDDPRLAPEGSGAIVIRTPADYPHFARYRPAWGKRAASYGEYKTRLGRALVRAAERLVPGLESAVTVMDVATPLTFKDRGGRSEGAVAGWSWDFEDNPDYRPVELVRTPVEGLFMAGYQAYSALFMGGVPMALASGQRAAEAVLHGAGPEASIRIPGATM